MKIGGQTFIASDVPGSSSNLYSDSGSKAHSLDSTAFLSDIAKFSKVPAIAVIENVLSKMMAEFCRTHVTNAAFRNKRSRK